MLDQSSSKILAIFIEEEAAWNASSDFEALKRRKIRLIESHAKCRYLKKLTLKGTLWQVFYLSEAPSPPMTSYSPPPYTLYCIRVYSILIHTKKGGRGERAN